MLHLIFLASQLPAAAALAPEPAALTATSAVALRQDVETWIEKGRKQIQAGDLTGARATLEQAAALDSAGDQSTVWLLRLQVAEGEWDEVLSAASRMKREGKNSQDLAYVTGMALSAKCQAALAGGDAGSVGFLLEDAKTALADAVEADGERYGDAWIELARVALLTGDSETSLKAARAELERNAEFAEAHLLAGRAELSLGAALYGGEGENPESAAHLNRARADLERALELAGEDVVLAGDAAMQLGTTAAYLGDDTLKRRAYTQALSFAPDNNGNVNTVWNTLGHADFQAAAEQALTDYGQRVGDDTSADATLRWWYAWSMYTTAEGDANKLSASAQEFTEVLKKAPAFVNSHYYLGRIAYDSERWEAAAGSWAEFRRYMGTDAAATFAGDEFGTARVNFVAGQVFGAGNLESAIAMGEILTELEPQNATFWNNLGLFRRDAGDVRRARLQAGDDEEAAAIQDLYETSYRAYSKALDLEPENPAYLNDTALVLHYNLQRDFEKAMEMYRAATLRAEALLEAGTLSEEERPVIEIALRDSKNNAAILERMMKGDDEEQSGADG